MSKFIIDAAKDALLADIATCTKMYFCSADPVNHAGIAAVKLAEVTLTAGAGNGDYVIADGDVSGKKLTVQPQTGISPSGDGDIVYLALDDGTTLRAGITITTKTVTTTQLWDSPAFDVAEVKDPT